jgi:hypothetical protein
MRLFKYRLLILSIPCILFLMLVVTRLTSQIIAQPLPPTPHELWNSRGGRNYEMIVEVLALPVPPVAQALTIKDGEIVKNSIVACDNPSEEYPAWACEPVKTYYASNGLYTIDELFDMADFGLTNTRKFMRKCRAAGRTMFQDFPNSDVMFAMAKTCDADLQGMIRRADVQLVVLTAVEYDSYYGYPVKITSYTPDAADGMSIIMVKNFRLTE